MTGQYKSTTLVDGHEDVISGRNFAMINFMQIRKLLELVVQRKLELRDLTMLLAIVSHMKRSSGLCFATSLKIAETVSANPTVVYSSVKRLQVEKVIIKTCYKKTGQYCFLVNPWVIYMGTPKHVGFLKKTFMQHLEGENPFTTDELDATDEDDLGIQDFANDLIKRAANMNHST